MRLTFKTERNIFINMIENENNITLKEFINNSYNDLLKSMNNDKYVIEYNAFDLFLEICHEGEVVGFISLESHDDALILNECYVKDDATGNNLFYDSFSGIVNGTSKMVFLRKPSKDIVNALIKNDLAYVLDDDIAVSRVDFIATLGDMFKNSKIKQNYRKVRDSGHELVGNLYDLNLCAVLAFDYDDVVSRDFETLIIFEARKNDLKKYSIRKKLKKVQPKYLKGTYELIAENIQDAYDFFKDTDSDFSNSKKIRARHSDLNYGLVEARPNSNFIGSCPVCDSVILKSSLYCGSCGFDLDSTVIRNRNLDKPYDAEDDDADEEFLKSLEEFKKSYTRNLTTLRRIDYGLLDIDKSLNNKNDEKAFKEDIATYMTVKYTDENPTTWNIDHSYNDYIDPMGINNAIDEGYVEKIMPEDFAERFEKFSKEELIRESLYAIDPDTPKEKVIEQLTDEGDYSWIVSERGHEYLEAHPMYDFFATYIKWFNFYEFKLFYDKNLDKLGLEEIGNEYITRKLEKAFSKNEYDTYLIYMDYHFTLNMKRQDYASALAFLAQRIIYEINTWYLYDYHAPFDEALSLQTDELLFQFKKLNLDLDAGEIYKRAFDDFMIPQLKSDYNRNMIYFKRLLGDENIFDISGEMIENEQKKGNVKSPFSFKQ